MVVDADLIALLHPLQRPRLAERLRVMLPVLGEVDRKAVVEHATGVQDAGVGVGDHGQRSDRGQMWWLRLRNKELTHSVSTHLTTPCLAFPRYPSARRASAAFAAVWTSPLNRRLVGLPGRIEFVILRNGLSPPVASDPTLR